MPDTSKETARLRAKAYVLRRQATEHKRHADNPRCPELRDHYLARALSCEMRAVALLAEIDLLWGER